MLLAVLAGAPLRTGCDMGMSTSESSLIVETDCSARASLRKLLAELGASGPQNSFLSFQSQIDYKSYTLTLLSYNVKYQAYVQLGYKMSIILISRCVL